MKIKNKAIYDRKIVKSLILLFRPLNNILKHSLGCFGRRKSVSAQVNAGGINGLDEFLKLILESFVKCPKEDEVLALILDLFINIEPFFVAKRLFSRAGIPLDARKTGDVKDHIEVRKLALTVEVVDGMLNIGCLINKLGQNEFFKLRGRDHIAEVALHRIPRLFGRDVHPGDEGKILLADEIDLLFVGNAPLAADFLGEIIYLVGIVVKIVEQIFGAAERCYDVHNAAKVGDREADFGVFCKALLHSCYMLPHLALLVKFHDGRVFPIGYDLRLIEPYRVFGKLKSAAKAGGKAAGTEVCEVSGDALGEVDRVFIPSLKSGVIVFGVEPLLFHICGRAVRLAARLCVCNIEDGAVGVFALPEFFVFRKYGLMLLLKHNFRLSVSGYKYIYIIA